MYGRGVYGKARYGQWSYKDAATTGAAVATTTASLGRVLVFSAAAITAASSFVANSPVTLKAMETSIGAVSATAAELTTDPIYEAGITAQSSVSADMLRVRPFASDLEAISETSASIQHSPTLGSAVLAGSDFVSGLNRVLSFGIDPVEARAALAANVRGRYVNENPSAPVDWTPTAPGADIWTPVSDTPPIWQEVA